MHYDVGVENNIYKQVHQHLYNYNTLYLLNFFLKNIHILFSCSVITTALQSWLGGTPVEIWGAENISFMSCDWILCLIE